MFEKSGLSDVIFLGSIGTLSVKRNATEKNPKDKAHHNEQDEDYNDNNNASNDSWRETSLGRCRHH